MQQSIVKFYCFVVQTLLQHVSGIITPIIRSPSNLLTNRPRLRTRPPPHSYGNQRLQRQFDGLLMMGIVMPETRWAVSVRQSNKILRLIVACSWVFYLSDWRCTKLQNLKKYYIFWVCGYSLSYPAWKAHAPCNMFICGLSGSNSILSHYLINGRSFRDKKIRDWT